ncbi:hypothetical protein GCM10010460_15180 [Microbacterium terrae]|nr:hypothetical protein GCM10017594_14060 [Microbacterium terrae]
MAAPRAVGRTRRVSMRFLTPRGKGLAARRIHLLSWLRKRFLGADAEKDALDVECPLNGEKEER